MLKEEEIKKVVEKYTKFFDNNGIKEGIVYDADVEIPTVNEKVIGFACGINKFRFAQYPHLEVKLINSRMEEVINVVFMSEEECGDPLSEYDLKSIRNDIIFSLESFSSFIKDIKAGKIKSSLYLNEKKNLEAQLEALNRIIEENGIKED